MDLVSPTITQRGNNYDVSHGSDASLIVEFVMEPVFMEAKSTGAGRKIYEDRPYIHIRFPGDKTREIFRPIQEDDKDRFHRQWAAFERQNVQSHTGTPIEQYPPLSKAQVLELKAINVHTVEQLANIPDSAGHTVGMGFRELRSTAQKWLENANGGAAVTSMQAEIERLKADLEAQKALFIEHSQKRSKRKEEGE